MLFFLEELILADNYLPKNRRMMMQLSYENSVTLRFADQVNKVLIDLNASVDENAL